MVKSKRSKIVSLTKTSKKGREQKDQLIDQVRDAAQAYKHIWLFSVENMRNSYFKQVRLDMREEGRIFYGKNRVMAKALGMEASEEVLPGIHQLAAKLKGDVGLLFTNEKEAQIRDYFSSLGELDYARPGCICTHTVILNQEAIERDGGIRRETDLEFVPATAEPQLRQLGVPTKLRGGAILLADKEYAVCQEGEVLNAEQTRVLKLLGIQMAQFKVHLQAQFSKGTLSEYNL